MDEIQRFGIYRTHKQPHTPELFRWKVTRRLDTLHRCALRIRALFVSCFEGPRERSTCQILQLQARTLKRDWSPLGGWGEGKVQTETKQIQFVVVISSLHYSTAWWYLLPQLISLPSPCAFSTHCVCTVQVKYKILFHQMITLWTDRWVWAVTRIPN